MQMDEAKVRRAIAAGWSFVCAFCVKAHRASDKGSETCTVELDGKSCGGPIGGNDFPEYEGPMTPSLLAQKCFMCGEPSGAGIRVKGRLRVIGVCQEHLDDLPNWRKKSERKMYLNMHEKREEVVQR